MDGAESLLAAERTLARRKAPDCGRFFEDYVSTSRPAVFVGLFGGQPILRLDTQEAMIDALGNLCLEVTKPYHSDGFAAFRNGSRFEGRRITLRDYFEHVDQHPETQLLCVEQPTPPELYEMFEPPIYCAAGPAEDGWESRLFVGNKGNTSNLHFDADFRAVLLHQVFGAKRLVLVPPSQSPKLVPFLNLSRLELARITGRDREEFLTYVHGYQTVLLPGETAYIPTAYWHHLDYLENSLSVNIRLPRNEFLRIIGARGIHKVWRLACVAASAADPTTLTSTDHADMLRVHDVLHGPATPDKKLALMDALIRELYECRCPDLPREEYARMDEGINERSVWQLLLDQGVLYAD